MNPGWAPDGPRMNSAWTPDGPQGDTQGDPQGPPQGSSQGTSPPRNQGLIIVIFIMFLENDCFFNDLMEKRRLPRRPCFCLMLFWPYVIPASLYMILMDLLRIWVGS